MGHLSNSPAGPSPSKEGPLDREPGAKSHRWLWIVGVLVVVAVSVWYFRGSRASTEAQGPNAPAGSTKGQGRGAGGAGFVVPVVVAAAQRGDEDAEALKQQGVAAVFQPGSSLDSIVSFIRSAVPA